jgi:hypothetical protein
VVSLKRFLTRMVLPFVCPTLVAAWDNRISPAPSSETVTIELNLPIPEFSIRTISTQNEASEMVYRLLILIHQTCV